MIENTTNPLGPFNGFYQITGTELNPVYVIRGWNSNTSAYQNMTFEVRDFGVSRNNATLASDLGNIRIQATEAGAHVGINIAGTSYSQFVVMRDGALDTFLGVRGAQMASGSDLTEEARIWMRNAGATIQSLKGYVNLDSFTAEARVTGTASPFLSLYTAGTRRAYFQGNNSTNKLRIHSDLTNGTVFENGANTENANVTDAGLGLPTIGRTISVKTGANAKIGQATLVAGTITVANTSVTANSRIFLSVSTVGGTQGILSYTKINGTSFTVNSSNAADTSTVDWWIVESIP